MVSSHASPLIPVLTAVRRSPHVCVVFAQKSLDRFVEYRGVVAALLLLLTGSALLAEQERSAAAVLPIVAAHRGACGYRPEHTLASYQLAADLGADYIEIDLVSTKDHVLVARHENELSLTTDVTEHSEFGARKTTKTVDGIQMSGWFAEDFTLAELKTLRSRERLPSMRPANTAYDGRFEIPTLDEIIALSQRNHIGIFIEFKHSRYLRELGLPLEEVAVDLLHRAYGQERHGRKQQTGDNQTVPIFLQSFEPSSVKKLHSLTAMPTVQLIDSDGSPPDDSSMTYEQMLSDSGLAAIKQYANAINVAKQLLISPDSGSHSTLVKRAHRAGLAVYSWTFRSENAFLAPALRRGDANDPNYLRLFGDASREYNDFYALGLSGVISDYPDTALAARAALH